jgi:hypothetical protein
MTTTTTKRRCGGVFAYGQMLLRVSKTFWRSSLSRENGETMGAEKVEQKVPPGIECGEYIENLSIHVGIQQQPKQQQAPKY